MKIGAILLLTIIFHETIHESTKDVPEKRLPDAIIIGVKKAGTRALLEYLKLNPNIKSPSPEIHFFDKFYHKGLRWYRDQMAPAWPWQTIIEKTPSYFVTKQAPYRIFVMNPLIKLILVVRNPVTRAISDYTQNVAKKPGFPSFPRMAFLTESTVESPAVNVSWGAIKIGLYYKHLTRWLKYFPLHQIHIVDGEKLITNPAPECRLVEHFLGMKNPVINEKNFIFKNSRKLDDQLRKPIDLPCLVNKFDHVTRCLGKTKGRRHVEVSLKFQQVLADHFKPHNEKFFALIGRRFDWENI